MFMRHGFFYFPQLNIKYRPPEAVRLSLSKPVLLSHRLRQAANDKYFKRLVTNFLQN